MFAETLLRQWVNIRPMIRVHIRIDFRINLRVDFENGGKENSEKKIRKTCRTEWIF